MRGFPVNSKLITCKVYIFFNAISTCVPKVRNYGDFRRNYMHVTGYPVWHGDSLHFLWGKHLQCMWKTSTNSLVTCCSKWEVGCHPSKRKVGTGSWFLWKFTCRIVEHVFWIWLQISFHSIIWSWELGFFQTVIMKGEFDTHIH